MSSKTEKDECTKTKEQKEISDNNVLENTASNTEGFSNDKLKKEELEKSETAKTLEEKRNNVYKNVRATKEIDIDAIQLQLVAYSINKNKLIFTDMSGGALKVLDLKSDTVSTCELEKIKSPIEICFGKDESVFITEISVETIKIYKFDSDMKYLWEIDTKMAAGTHSMMVDLSSSENLLYVSNWSSDEISIWNSETGESIKTIEVYSPLYMDSNKDYLYVVSYLWFERDPETNRLTDITNGFNCIYVLSKSNYKVIKKVDSGTWLQPEAVYVDKYLNVYTAAYDMDENKAASVSRFLFIIDNDDNILQKIPLYGVSECNSMLFFDNKVAFVQSKSVKIIEFE